MTATVSRIRDITSKKDEQTKNTHSLLYEIPCGGCDKKYYGETSRGIETRLKEHKADIRHHRPNSALVNHVDDQGHLPKWSEAKTLQMNLSKQHRKAWESIYITLNKENLNKRTGDIVWAEVAAEIAARGTGRDS